MKEAVTAPLLKVNEARVTFNKSSANTHQFAFSNTEAIGVTAVGCEVSNDNTSFSDTCSVPASGTLYIRNISSESSFILSDKFKVKKMDIATTWEAGVINYSGVRSVLRWNESLVNFSGNNFSRYNFDVPFNFKDLNGTSISHLYINNANDENIVGTFADANITSLKGLGYFGTNLRPFCSAQEFSTLCPQLKQVTGDEQFFSDGDYSDFVNSDMPLRFITATFSDGGTWASTSLRDMSKGTLYGRFWFKTSTDVDNFLVNIANCQFVDIASNMKYINIKSDVPRTSASDAAVAVLTANGISVGTY